MSKRVANKEINHDNWAEEEEAEEAGTFQQASEDEIKKRVIKTARRRTNNAVESAPKTVFTGFSFTKTEASDKNQTKTSSLSGIFGNGQSKLLGNKEETQSKDTSESSVKISDEDTDEFDPKFYSHLKALNRSVSRWIKKFVDADPLCLLSPIFKDYEKHLRDLEAKYKKNKNDSSAASDISILKNIAGPSSSDSKDIFKGTPISSCFGAKPLETSNSTSRVLGGKDESNTVEPKKAPLVFNTGSATFSFGNSLTSPQSSLPTAGFNFGTGAPPTFGVSQKSAVEAEEEAAEDEPPKVDFKAVIEEDSVYNIRCKVFIKKNDTYTDGGVGNLFLKPVKDTNKTQLIVRADTNLGNLLINVILNESIPTQRMGKNNVMMVCVPTPDKSPTPSSILLRVKTAEQADELLETINKYKC